MNTFNLLLNSINQLTLTVHGNIGQMINSFTGQLIRKLDNMSWSENIHGKASECTCWIRI